MSRCCRLILSLVLLLALVSGDIVPVGALPLQSAQKVSATIIPLKHPLKWLLEVARSLFPNSSSASTITPYGSDSPTGNGSQISAYGTNSAYGTDNPQANLLP